MGCISQKAGRAWGWLPWVRGALRAREMTGRLALGSQALGHNRPCGRAVAEMSQYCPSPPRPQLQAAGEALASDQTLHTASPCLHGNTKHVRGIS